MSQLHTPSGNGWDEVTASPTDRKFETPGQVRIRVDNVAGLVEIETHDAPTTEVRVAPLNDAAAELASRARISEHAFGSGHEVIVEIPHERKRNWFGHTQEIGVWVRVPSGAELEVSTVSAPLNASGRYGRAELHTVSGEIRIEEITGQATIRTVSGNLEVGSVGDVADVQSASGDVRIDVAGAGGRVSTASGDIALGRVEKPAAPAHGLGRRQAGPGAPRSHHRDGFGRSAHRARRRGRLPASGRERRHRRRRRTRDARAHRCRFHVGSGGERHRHRARPPRRARDRR